MKIPLLIVLLMLGLIIGLHGAGLLSATGQPSSQPASGASAPTPPVPDAPEGDLGLVEKLALAAPVGKTGRTFLPPDEVTSAAIARLKAGGKADHLPLLVEYGLRLHLKALILSRLSREMDPAGNPAIAELIRLAEIPKFRTAHEGGWLNRQFYGEFTRAGWSTYQVYLWAKEHASGCNEEPNAARLTDLIKQIEATGIHGVGGGGVCHYECQ